MIHYRDAGRLFDPCRRGLLAGCVLLASCCSVAATEKLRTAVQGSGDYVADEVMIPMRDGIRLHARVLRPQANAGPLPILLQRSPYGFEDAAVARSFAAEFKELAEDGYIFVLQDIRGRFGSEGEFVMLRPAAKVDESTDAYDTVDWLTKSLPANNGSVGIFGVSYLGWTTAMSTINPHPALKAVSVQAAPEDMFLGDDFHHNGAFRLQYSWEYAAALETDGRTFKSFSYGGEDPYAWFLKQDDLANLDKRSLGFALPSWQNFVQHPNYDATWRATVTSTRMHPKVSVPNLIVAGWWDQEDFYGPLTIYREQEKGDARNRNFLVIGPWNHGGWARRSAERFGPFEFGSDTAAYFRAQIERPWFSHWLKGGKLDQPEAVIFETGSNQWRHYDAWPPKQGVTRQRLYLHADAGLSAEPPRDSPPDRFLSDPNDPVPYRQRPIDSTMVADTTWKVWLADDQAPLAQRKDVLSWQTPPLREDVTIRGEVVAELFASTTGSDADWIVKLIDVFPTDEATPAPVRGRHLMIANEVFRGRFHASFEKPRALIPNKVMAYEIDMHAASHVFKKGHRIAVQVHSTWFPLIDRNPQLFQPSIFQAKRGEFTAQTHSVFHSARFPSAIVVDVAGRAAGMRIPITPRASNSQPLQSR